MLYSRIVLFTDCCLLISLLTNPRGKGFTLQKPIIWTQVKEWIIATNTHIHTHMCTRVHTCMHILMYIIQILFFLATNGVIYLIEILKQRHT